MSRKLKYKIISCSSQQQQHPVSSLLFSSSQGWQTKRFCTFPQQITLQFYGIVNIRKLQLTSDHRKISSQVDILYYLPISSQQQRFYKYGYLQFNRSQGNNTKQVKTIMLDLNCLYIRFLFHKPHNSKQNFFSQIGIQSLNIYGVQNNQLLLREPQSRNDQEDIVNQQDQQYITNIITTLTLEKEHAIKQQDFQSANYYKNTIGLINNLAEKLKINRGKINRAIQQQDYDTAKVINQQIKKIKIEISGILQSKNLDDSGGEGSRFRQAQNYQDNQGEQNQFDNVNLNRQDNGNQFMQPQVKLSPNLSLSRKTNPKNLIHSNIKANPRVQTQSEYDQRVIPALRSDKLKTQNDQFAQQKPKDLPPPQQVEGKYIKQATMMQDFFDQETIKKYFSQYWQHNLESLNTILAQIKTKHQQPGLLKCLIIVVKYSLQQTNFQVAQQSLNLFVQLLKINNNSQSINKPGQLQNDLDQIGRQVIKKMTDNNPKIKTASQQAFSQMIGSMLYGVQACCHALAKFKGKLSSKQISTRLVMITKMIQQYGISTGSNSVPLTCLDFAIANVNNPSDQVRKYSVSLLSMAYKKDKDKTSQKIIVLKQSIIEQIQGNNMNTPQKQKKK